MIQGRELSDSKFQLDALDGLRGMAVLLVILSHTSNQKIYFLPFADFRGNGKSGVVLFFVLSAFLLTLPFIKKGAASINKKFLLNYCLRRFLRIYPLYIIYLLLELLTGALSKITSVIKPNSTTFVLTPKEFIDHILLLQGKGVTWSIAVEFQYYFFLPFLALTYALLLKNKLVHSVLLTIGLIVLSQVFWPQAQSLGNDIRLGPYLPVFFMGSLLAVIWHYWETNNLGANMRWLIIIEISGVLALVLIIFMIPSVSGYILDKKVPADYYHRYFMQFGLLWSVVLFCCLAGLGWVKSFFELAFLRYLGFISFSAYLFHVFAISAIRHFAPGLPLQGWIMLALTIAVSTITWLLIERPSSKIKLV